MRQPFTRESVYSEHTAGVNKFPKFQRNFTGAEAAAGIELRTAVCLARPRPAEFFSGRRYRENSRKLG